MDALKKYIIFPFKRIARTKMCHIFTEYAYIFCFFQIIKVVSFYSISYYIVFVIIFLQRCFINWFISNAYIWTLIHILTLKNTNKWFHLKTNTRNKHCSILGFFQLYLCVCLSTYVYCQIKNAAPVKNAWDFKWLTEPCNWDEGIITKWLKMSHFSLSVFANQD